MDKQLRVNAHLKPSEILEKDQSISLVVQDDSSWSDVCNLIKEKLSVSFTESLAFQYLDEVADYISGCTEEEWKDAIAMGSMKSRDERVLHINVVPTKNVGAQTTSCTSGNWSACCPSSTVARERWCCFERPIPEKPVYDGVVPKKVVNPLSPFYKYAGEALRAVALPLGPIGGGSIALAGDGGLRQWQVVNSVYHKAHVPDSFFAIKVDDGSSTPKCVVLQSNTLYDESGFKPAPYITDHVVPDASKDLLNKLPGVKTLEVTAKYPIAEVDVLSKEVPVNVHLEAFNPCIPLNAKDSGIPMIVLNYTVTNPNPNPVKVTMLGSLTNFVGWDGVATISADDFPNFVGGGNQNTLYTYQGNTDGGDQYKDLSGYYGIYMNNTLMSPRYISNGELSIGVVTKQGDRNACYLQFADVTEMWKYFKSSEGLPGQGESGVSDRGKTWCGALSCSREIQAKQSETFTFVLSWHFPYRYSNWKQQVPTNSKSYLGNQYTNFWSDIKEVLKYTTQNIGTFTQLTRQFRDAMFDSSLPWQLIDSAAGRLSVLRSPSFMWLEDSNLYCFEGCNSGRPGGCCPLNCTHVLNYEMAAARCYPDLERTMRIIDLVHNISPNYIIPSRTSVPLSIKRQWEDWNWWTNPNSPIDLSSTTICLDGDLGTVLKTYREIRQGAPASFFNELWPRIKLMMNRYMTKLDDKGQGIITKAQPCTYDTATYGVDTFIGCLYLCALRAAEEMAKLQNDLNLAQDYRDRFTKGSQYLDELCFTNEKWYTQVVPQENPVETLSDGTFVDALIGQWWAHSLGLGYLLPKDHIQSHLQWVFKRNHVDSFNPETQKPRQFFDQRDAGLLMCSWGDEKKPRVPLLYSLEGAWSGVVHPFVGLCLYENLNDIALHAAKDCRDKYDGTRRSPWNEIECGDHYVRPMGAFLYFEIVAGMTWDIVAVGEQTVKLNFAPKISPENFKSFFILGSGWGSYCQKIGKNETGADVELAVTYGHVEILELGLSLTCSTAQTTLDGKEIKTTVTKKNSGIILTFQQQASTTRSSFLPSDSVLTIAAGQTLKIVLS